MRRLFSYMPIVAVAVLFSLFSCQSKKGEKQSGDVRLPEISVAYPAVDSVVLIKSYPGYAVVSFFGVPYCFCACR